MIVGTCRRLLFAVFVLLVPVLVIIILHILWYFASVLS